ncbi:DUF3267 domain-containing protein [Infirmifilum lucidum]|uniref:DUF3267 domain-containing protein n=1 Tax=Infirmifilum lucidum TaxID=2776706 RepID=A0A7L9FJW2_9CREN|nr:DUF3267 domain-containing protein [Infirmifilum lucidum]QOJ79085.1 DUF3267 domain-containing protein [Infirmifilum lucidum]
MAEVYFDVLRHKRETVSMFMAMFFLWSALAGEVGVSGLEATAWLLLGVAAGVLLHESIHIATLRAVGVREVEIKPFYSKWVLGVYVKSHGRFNFKEFAAVALAPLFTLTPLSLVAARLTAEPVRLAFIGAGLVNTAGASGDVLLTAVAASVGGSRIFDRGTAVEIRGCCINPYVLLPIVFVDYLVWALIGVSIPAYFASLAASGSGGLYLGPLPLVRVVVEATETSRTIRTVVEPAFYRLVYGSALALASALTALRWKKRVLNMLSK